MTDTKYKTLEERVAYLEAKLERQEKIEDQLKRTQEALTNLAGKLGYSVFWKKETN